MKEIVGGKGLMSHDEFVLAFPGRFEDDEVAAAEIRRAMT